MTDQAPELLHFADEIATWERDKGDTLSEVGASRLLSKAMAALTRPTPAERPMVPEIPFDPTNHHNALKCPYCNPDGLVLVRPAERPVPHGVRYREEGDETIARRLATIEHGDDAEWKGFLTRAHHWMSLAIDANDPVASTGPEGPVPQVREALQREVAFVRDMMDIERAEGQKQSTWQLLRDLADRLERLAALAARPSDAAVGDGEIERIIIEFCETDSALNLTYSTSDGVRACRSAINLAKVILASPPDEPARVTPSTVGVEDGSRSFEDAVLAAAHKELPSACLELMTCKVNGIERAPFSTLEFAREILRTLSHTLASEKECESDQTKENK